MKTLVATAIMTILWMMCEQKYSWTEEEGAEEARKDLLEQMRYNLDRPIIW